MNLEDQAVAAVDYVIIAVQVLVTCIGLYLAPTTLPKLVGVIQDFSRILPLTLPLIAIAVAIYSLIMFVSMAWHEGAALVSQ